MKERHEQIIEAIKGFYQEHGFCPTVRQIGDMVGLKSTSSVQTHLEKMEELGLIVRGDFSSPRSIRIPGFNYEKAVNDNKNSCSDNGFAENETQNAGFGTVFVLHGFWITGDDSGVDVFGVSADLELLRDKMRQEAKRLLDEAQKTETSFIVSEIEESGTKYEIEGDYGDMIKLYITEHEVEKRSQEA